MSNLNTGIKKSWDRHYEDKVLLNAPSDEVFEFADNHANFSSHMSKSSWMMGGGSMKTEIDEGMGQVVGSHIKLSGKVFDVEVYLDEVVTSHAPPRYKTWETVGDLNLIVIGHYKMGFNLEPMSGKSEITVSIDYDLPTKNRWLGILAGDFYAKWCVKQMLDAVKARFNQLPK